eukprot:Skav221779  [mRNA]  locus=scaffold2426:275619:277445:+ [translate_table: standard]
MGCGNILIRPTRAAAIKPWVAEDEVQAEGDGDAGPASALTVEERAILLSQLQGLMATMTLRMSEKPSLMSTGAKSIPLSTSSCNLYDTMHHFIKPATKQRKCSYVELVAEGPQLSQWFVSHWWGEPVVQFIACIEKHSHHRKLTEVPYWVCAYANNQWQLGDELGADPRNSSFRRALDVSVGTLSILDDCATVYSRIWCDYEVYVTLNKGTWTTHLYDIYTWQQGEVVGLTDGVAPIDQRGASWWWEDKKHQREKNFPLDLAKAAMKIRVQQGEASVEEDRRRILHAICGTDLSGGQVEEPPTEHPAYDGVNATLHARFALSTWVLALQHGEDVQSYARVLSASHLTRISLSFRSKSYVTDAMLMTLATALPKTLKELCLVITRCKKLSDEGILAVAAAMGNLPLEHLHLDLAHSSLTDAALEAVCSNLPWRSLKHLWLSIGMNKEVTNLSVQHLANSLASCPPDSAVLQELFVALVQCPKITGQSLHLLGSVTGSTASWTYGLRSYSLLLGSLDLEDADLLVALEGLPQSLEEFFLDCWACSKLTLKVLMVLGEKLRTLHSLRLLELTFGEIPGISGVNGRHYAQRTLAPLPDALAGHEQLEIRFYT